MEAPLDSLSVELLRAAAGEPKRVIELLQSGANVNCADPVNRRTPLHLAAAHGHLEAVQALLSRGANVSALDVYNLTPCFVADHQRHRRCEPTAAAACIQALRAEERQRARVDDDVLNGALAFLKRAHSRDVPAGKNGGTSGASPPQGRRQLYIIKHPMSGFFQAGGVWYTQLPDKERQLLDTGEWKVMGFGVASKGSRLGGEFLAVQHLVYPGAGFGRLKECSRWLTPPACDAPVSDKAPDLALAAERQLKELVRRAFAPSVQGEELCAHFKGDAALKTAGHSTCSDRVRGMCRLPPLHCLRFYHPACDAYELHGWRTETVLMHATLCDKLFDGVDDTTARWYTLMRHLQPWFDQLDVLEPLNYTEVKRRAAAQEEQARASREAHEDDDVMLVE